MCTVKYFQKNNIIYSNETIWCKELNIKFYKLSNISWVFHFEFKVKWKNCNWVAIVVWPIERNIHWKSFKSFLHLLYIEPRLKWPWIGWPLWLKNCPLFTRPLTSISIVDMHISYVQEFASFLIDTAIILND